MRCSDIMKRDVQRLLLDDTLLTAARIMRDTHVGFLPVCADDRVVGVLTDRDITIRVAAEDWRPSSVRVSEVMTQEVISCNPHDSIQVAERLMATHHKSRIVIVDAEGALLGLISLSDLVKREDLLRAAETVRDVATRPS